MGKLRSLFRSGADEAAEYKKIASGVPKAIGSANGSLLSTNSGDPDRQRSRIAIKKIEIHKKEGEKPGFVDRVF